MKTIPHTPDNTLGTPAQGEEAGQTAAQRVAAEIRGLMAKRKLTGADLAHFLNVHRSTAARRVNGESDLTIDEIVDIAAWLDVPVTRLINAAVGTGNSSE